MDYQIELERLKKMETYGKSKFWKPEAGKHQIKALGELEDAPMYEEEGKEPQLRKQLLILEKDVEHLWSMPFGKTPASTYGQLVALGVTRGKLTDAEFTVVVTGAGQNKRFTIVD